MNNTVFGISFTERSKQQHSNRKLHSAIYIPQLPKRLQLRQGHFPWSVNNCRQQLGRFPRFDVLLNEINVADFKYRTSKLHWW